MITISHVVPGAMLSTKLKSAKFLFALVEAIPAKLSSRQFSHHTVHFSLSLSFSRRHDYQTLGLGEEVGLFPGFRRTFSLRHDDRPKSQGQQPIRQRLPRQNDQGEETESQMVGKK